MEWLLFLYRLRRKLQIGEWAHLDSNQEPSGYEPRALPLSYRPLTLQQKERVAGIEPAYLAWKANVLPLNYTRSLSGRTSS
jgi:hypothetical protein